MSMSLVKVKTKYQVTLPTAVRSHLEIHEGDMLEASVQKGRIILTPKTMLDKAVVDGLRDVVAGRVEGPFHSAKAVLAALYGKE